MGSCVSVFLVGLAAKMACDGVWKVIASALHVERGRYGVATAIDGVLNVLAAVTLALIVAGVLR